MAVKRKVGWRMTTWLPSTTGMNIMKSVYPAVDGWAAQCARDHRRVLAALRKGDGDAARTAMDRHLCAGSKPLIDHLAGLGVID